MNLIYKYVQPKVKKERKMREWGSITQTAAMLLWEFDIVLNEITVCEKRQKENIFKIQW